MATFSDSDDKILLFNNNGPPQSNQVLFWENTLLVWFTKDQHWVEIIELMKFSCQEDHCAKCGSDLQLFKHDVLENFDLQISGFSRQ